MNRSHTLFAVLVVFSLSGCSLKNLKEPDYVDLTPVRLDDQGAPKALSDVELAFLSIYELKKHYIPYANGAATNRSTLSSLALFGAATAAVGAATHSGSELYKSSAAIIATAFGLEEWGNFKAQRKVYQDAVDYLLCAERTSRAILLPSPDFKGRLSALSSEQDTQLAGYGHRVAAARGINPSDVSDLKSGLRRIQNEEADIAQAMDISRKHGQRVLRDVAALQRNVSDAIIKSSFDTHKAVAGIVPKQATESVETTRAGVRMVDSENVLGDAHAIIDASNEYEQCLAKTVQPEAS